MLVSAGDHPFRVLSRGSIERISRGVSGGGAPKKRPGRAPFKVREALLALCAAAAVGSSPPRPVAPLGPHVRTLDAPETETIARSETALCRGTPIGPCGEAGATVRTVTRRGSSPPISSRSMPSGPLASDAEVCGVVPHAWHGQPVPGGGTLIPAAFFWPSTIGPSGRVAFVASIDGSERNQGLFVADSEGLRVIVRGCGGGGGSGNPGSGCGDPSPIGGSFSGLFLGTAFVPDINVNGDVLFLSDVDQGSSPRGLFLYRAAEKQIVKVAAVGDAFPTGGLLGAIGPGSLNASGEVVFLASTSTAGPADADILFWRKGVATKFAAVGDPAPGGGTFSYLGTEWSGFVDDTWVPTGPAPDINDAGQVSFRAYVSGGTAAGGLLVSTGREHRWTVKVGDPTPAGGSYVDFFAPTINNSGKIAFFADYQRSPGDYSSGWFAGSPSTHWRKALAFYDPIDGGACWGLAVSRNPIQAIDDDGDVLLWTSVLMPGGEERERFVISPENGVPRIVARQGDSSPLGGRIGALQAWPSLRAGRGTLSTQVVGAPDGVFSAHMVFLRGPRAIRGVEVRHGGLPDVGVALSWDGQESSDGSLMRYDVTRGTLSGLRSGGPVADAVCAANDLTTPSFAEPEAQCPAGPGDGCWYLVRGQNDCATGIYGPAALDDSTVCP